MLNKKGTKLVEFKRDYIGASKSSKEILANALKKMTSDGEFTEEIYLKLTNDLLNVREFEKKLEEMDGYFVTKEEIISGYCKDIIDELSKEGCSYISGICEGNNLVLVKKLGLSQTEAKEFFEYPEVLEIKKKGAKNKAEKEAIEANKKEIEDCEVFLEKFVKMRFPKIKKYLIEELSKQDMFNSETGLKFEVSDVYYSEKIDGYNIDFRVIIPEEYYLNNKSIYYKKDAMLNNLKFIIKFTNNKFHKKLGF